MITIIIICAVAALLLFAPLVIKVTLENSELTVRASYLFVSYTSGPSSRGREGMKILFWNLPQAKEKSKKEKKEPKGRAAAKAELKEARKKQKKKQYYIVDIIDIACGAVRSAGKLLRKLFRALRVRRLELSAIVAEGDAAQTAITYGRLNAVVSGAYAFLSNLIHFGNIEISIRPDFTAVQSSERLYAVISASPGSLLAALIAAAVDFLLFMLGRGSYWPQQAKRQQGSE